MKQTLPERINRLDELAGNLWWSWHHDARRLFRSLDYPTWVTSSHNPVKQLHDMTADKFIKAASDPAFIQLYDSVVSAFDADISIQNSWFTRKYHGLISGPIAYFSAEFALHRSLPIYAGGLGVLAGDICKESCDLGIPLVGIGFMYPQGYFHQHISADGWQEEIYEQLNFNEAPVYPLPWPAEKDPLVLIQLADRPLHLRARQVRLGRARLYLLDTNVEQNDPVDRLLSARLYTADREQRLQQEIALGIGGVRALRALGIDPSIWHANEGHTAFMTLERIREYVETGISFNEAVSKVRANTVFTTHTPIPAGHDTFPDGLMDTYFHNYWGLLGIDRNTFLQMGQANGSDHFNMTALILRMAGQSCGVSAIHEKVSKKMWHILWPNINEDKVPITHITNGVHIPTWIAPELYQLYEKYLGAGLLEKQDDSAYWEKINDIPDSELWSVHQLLKRRLMRMIRERTSQRWMEGGVSGEQIVAMGTLLNSERLTIGFCRRFAEYKRPYILFQDMERLKRIINHPSRPVQIIFAGKSHPADFASKCLLQQVYNSAKSHDFQGRIAFVEDYDLNLARYLVHGVDIWLNAPRRLQEACGTSGMKASLNGVPHFSVRDGWWDEAYNGKNGWAIGPESAKTEEEDNLDSLSFYQFMEEKIVPLYYERDREGIPHEWINIMKESIRTIAPAFSARRMVKNYVEKMYVNCTNHSIHFPYTK